MIYFKLKCRLTNELMFVGMDPGSSSGVGPSGVGPGPRPPSARGPEDRVLRKRVIRYRKRPGEPYSLYFPFGQALYRPCECYYTYGYPDEVVLAVDDERCYLRRACDHLTRQLEEARERDYWQARRVRDLERSLRDEVERTDALRRQLHDTHQHLFALKGQLRERARSIMMDCKVLLDVTAEAPPRAIGPAPMDEIDTLGSVGDWAPRGGI